MKYRKEWGKNILEKKYTKEEFVKLYNEYTTTDLVKITKCCRATIIDMARKYGLPCKKHGHQKGKGIKTIHISVKELENLYNTTRTIDLAKRFGISVATLVKIVKQNGIELKKPGWGLRERKIIVEG